MATQAVDLGPFAPEQGPTSRWAALAAALGLGAAGVTAVAILIDLGGAGTLRSRSWAVPFGGAALIAAIIGLYQVSVLGRKGRTLAAWGAAFGVSAAVVAFVHGGVQTGTLELREFGVAYFNRTVMANIWRDILKAAVNTVKYAAIAEAFGIVLGLAVATFVISKRWWLRIPATIYVDVVRGLPLLMLLLLVYFGPTFVGITWSSSIAAGLVALTINSSAYMAEIFRAGIQSVERGQMDAARSLGMPYATAMIQVIIPQAVRRVIPPLTNEFIALVKDTSLLLILGMTVSQRELLTAARQLSSDSFSATPYMSASILYLAITLPLTRVVTRLERRLQAGQSLPPIRTRTMSHGRGHPSG
ncbi:MAG: amino acid ABC transporter permease [Actinomycetota bacterium]